MSPALALLIIRGNCQPVCQVSRGVDAHHVQVVGGWHDGQPLASIEPHLARSRDHISPPTRLGGNELPSARFQKGNVMIFA